jgi:hypothetical protein
MDAHRFDTLTKTLTTPRSRRSLARLLGGVSLGSVLTALGVPDAVAGSRLGGDSCTRDEQCLSKKCFKRSKTCSCKKIGGQFSTAGCLQPANDCQKATCDLKTHHCVTTNRGPQGGMLVCGVGACTRQIFRCKDGVEQVCTPYEPKPEVCNGLDDDCDGVLDNGATCFDECGPGGGVCRTYGFDDAECVCA